MKNVIRYIFSLFIDIFLKLWISGDGFNIYYMLYPIYIFLLYNEMINEIIKDTIIITQSLALFHIIKSFVNLKSKAPRFPSGHVFLISIVYGLIIPQIIHQRIVLYYYPSYTILWIMAIGLFETLIVTHCKFHSSFDALVSVLLSISVYIFYELNFFNVYWSCEQRVYMWLIYNILGHIGTYLSYGASLYLCPIYGQSNYESILKKCIIGIDINYIFIVLQIIIYNVSIM